MNMATGEASDPLVTDELDSADVVETEA